MCLRKISAVIIACLILILLIPAIFNVVALADSGKPGHGIAITVQPGEEVIVTDTTTGPSPQEAKATGLNAAWGKGSVSNFGTVRSDAEATTKATSKGAIAGARSVGINGSGGDDYLLNNGTLSSKANSTITSLTLFINIDGFTLPFMRMFPPVIGGSQAESFAGGILGCNGDDSITNSGTMTVKALAFSTAGSIAVGVGAGAEATVSADAKAFAAGIRSGEGNDTIRNEGTLKVKATSIARAGSIALGVSGSDEDGSATVKADVSAKATARAFGIDAAAENTERPGRTVISNSAAIGIAALSTAKGHSRAESGAGGGIAVTVADAAAEASGIAAGSGNRLAAIQNTAALTVKSAADSLAFAHGGDDSHSHSKASANAVGIKVGDNNTKTFIFNSGPIKVDATADGRAEDGEPTMEAEGSAKAYGILVGNSSSDILHAGTMEVASTATATFLSSNDTVARNISSADAEGIGTGNGNQRLFIDGRISVAARADNGPAGKPYTATSAGRNTADATMTGIRTGSGDDAIVLGADSGLTGMAFSRTVSYGGGAKARAVGIDAGNGNNEIFLGGGVDIRADANATGSFSTASTTAFGIRTGIGSDRIHNRGSVTILAGATALIGDSDASATGIDAGHGDNAIRNEGALAVTSRSTVEFGSARARAYGILTGEGNDTVTNAGTILTSQTGVATGVSIETPGIAISTGGGSDRIFLEAGSETRGIIDLGSGDDTITFNGSLAVTGIVTGGAGNDTLVFSGDGVLGAPITGFETAIKDGPGTYTLSSLAQVKRLEMNGGTLAVNHGYQMPADGVFQARVNRDGSHGQFFVNGVAGLDGALNVVRGKGVYTNGTKYPILTANTVSGWFTSETLPAPSPLLSFQVTGFSDRVEVEALAKSFTTVATNPAQMRIAQMLDKAMVTATGKTADMLGEFQSLPAQDFQKAFTSLNPNTYDRFRRTSLTASQENIRSLHNRMTALRLTQPQYSAAVQAREMANTMSLFKTGPDSGMSPDQAWQLGRLSSAETREGSWMSAFGQRGNLTGSSGYTGYDYRMNGTVIGYDQRHGETLFTGTSSGFSRGEVGFEDKIGQGTIDGASSSIYGSWFANDTYMESALSFSRNHYSNHRSIVVGSLTQSAAAEHDGNLFTAYVSGGRYVDVNRWVFEPYASMLFTQTYEEGFQETGGGLSLRIHDDRTRSLVSDVGLRVARSYEMPFGKLIPEAGIAWIYDFRLDDRRITASLVDVDGSEFSLPGEQTGRHGARFEAGFSWLGSSGFAASIKYTGESRSGADDQGIFGYLRYEF